MDIPKYKFCAPKEVKSPHPSNLPIPYHLLNKKEEVTSFYVSLFPNIKH